MSRSGRRPSSRRGTRLITVFTVLSLAVLAALSVLAYQLPESDLVHAFVGGA